MINDIKDAVLEAQADLTEIVRDTMRDMILPMVEKQARQMWATMPDEMKERFKQERPQEYAALMKGMTRENGNRNLMYRAGNKRGGGKYG